MSGHRWWIALIAGALAACGGGAASQPAQTPVAKATVPPAQGHWETLPSMAAPRADFTATLLNDGRVLVAGGVGNVMVDGTAMSSVEIFDPTTRKFSAAAGMPIGRAGHTATLLRNGKVLVVGGYTAQGVLGLSSVEIFDPAAGVWATAGPLHQPRTGHAAVLLRDGKVLVVGGGAYPLGGGRSPHGAAPAKVAPETYDPATDTWTVGALPKFDRPRNPTANLLKDGRVLVVGGQDMWGSPDEATEQSEIFDPDRNGWMPAAADSRSGARQDQTATTLSNGEILVAGGSRDLQPTGLASLYDPTGNRWTEVGSLMSNRMTHAAQLLSNGNVLVAGAAGASAEEYVPAAGRWFAVAAMSTSRDRVAAVELRDGIVLVLGGVTAQPFAATGSAELFYPS